MSGYFSKPKSLEANVKVELDLPNYATKADFKKATSVQTSDFAIETDLANLKFDIDKLDIDKLKNLPSNLSNLKSREDKLGVHKLVLVLVGWGKLRYVVKNDVVKKRCI